MQRGIAQMVTSPQPTIEIQIWPIGRLVFYARNPRKNDAAVDRMCASIREFGFKIPVLARSDGEVVDGHLRLKAARKLGSWPGGDTSQIPVILCDEWTPQQVKAFRLMVNRSVAWADWDEELLALELQELNAEDFDLSLTGFNPGEIDGLLAIPDEERANAAPPVPENPVSRAGDLWLCGKHRVLCGDALRAEDVARLLGERKPILMVTDPPYGIELDSRVARPRRSERLRAGGGYLHEAPDRGPHRDHDLRRHPRRLVGGLRAGAQPADRLRLARLEVHPRGPERAAAHRLRAPPADHLGQGPHGPHAHALLVPA